MAVVDLTSIKKEKKEPSTKAHHTPSRRVNKRKRIRRLADENSNKRIRLQNTRQWPQRICIGVFVIVVILAAYYGQTKHFHLTYDKHYQQIAYGRTDYCVQSLNSKALSLEIAKQHGILNQEEAFRQLELGMRNDSSAFKALAVFGPSGVGKSMWAYALMQHFPWTDNVHAYVWNLQVAKTAEKLNEIRLLINKFNNCGTNLLIIDNLPPNEYQLVKYVNEMIKSALGDANDSISKRAIVIYIFNMNTLVDSETYQQQYELLQTLPDAINVNFQSFSIKELKDCVRHGALNENITLSENDFNEIIKTLNSTSSGCKMVNKKLLLYKKAEYNYNENCEAENTNAESWLLEADNAENCETEDVNAENWK